MITGALLCVAAGAVSVMAESPYVAYRSQTPTLPVAFEYPAGWTAERSRGSAEAYDQVQLFAPEPAPAHVRSYIAVRAMPAKAQGGRYADAADMIASYRQTQMPMLAVTGESTIMVLGVPAVQLEIRGQMALPWKAAHPEMVSMQGQRVFFEKDGRLYELSWMAPEESASPTAAAFGHVVRTLVPADEASPLP